MITPIIVDYGVGNLRSVQRALERLGVSSKISEDPADIVSAPAIMLPGVGAFGDAIRKLRDKGRDEAIREAALKRGTPLLGICLGMQLLARRSAENGCHQGLGLIAADVEPLANSVNKLRLPHMGWNEVTPTGNDALFKDVPNGTDFYFVHSFHTVCDDPAVNVATSRYGIDFCCAVRAGNIMGVQFHPEKSQKYGRQVLQNFLQIAVNL
jgi:glutamine amidotransferase